VRRWVVDLENRDALVERGPQGVRGARLLPVPRPPPAWSRSMCWRGSVPGAAHNASP